MKSNPQPESPFLDAELRVGVATAVPHWPAPSLASPYLRDELESSEPALDEVKNAIDGGLETVDALLYAQEEPGSQAPEASPLQAPEEVEWEGEPGDGLASDRGNDVLAHDARDADSALHDVDRDHEAPAAETLEFDDFESNRVLDHDTMLPERDGAAEAAVDIETVSAYEL